MIQRQHSDSKRDTHRKSDRTADGVEGLVGGASATTGG